MPYLANLGIQLYTVREQLAENPQTTLQALADIGYKQVELMDTRQLATLKPICDDLGLSVNSSFMQWTALTDRWDLVPDTPRVTFDQVLEQAVEGGVEHIVFGYMRPEEHETADAWKQHIESLNKAAERAKAAGVGMAYHNHNFEWAPVDGTTGWALLQQHLDGDLVPFEFDVAWAAMAGLDPAEVLTSIKDRVALVHLKNLKPLPAAYLTIETMPADSSIELGSGKLDIPSLMRLANGYNVQHCFYEQDNNWHPDAVNSARTSLEYLRA